MMILRKMKTKPRINISFQARTKFPFGQNVWVKIDGQFKVEEFMSKLLQEVVVMSFTHLKTQINVVSILYFELIFTG